MKLPVKNLRGEQVSEIELPDTIFAAKVSQPLMHQALIRQNANAHLGTHKVKTRAEVVGTTKKMKRQKGTGGARQGNMKAPHWTGGGVAFGPQPRSYNQDMPKKMRRAAVRSALSQKASDQQIIVIESLTMDAPKTKDFAAAMKALGVSKGLVVLPAHDANIEKSASNVDGVKALTAKYLNIRDIFKYDHLVIPVASINIIQEWLG